MKPICQGASALLAIAAGFGFVPLDVPAGEGSGLQPPTVTLVAWKGTPFPQVVLDNPQLAACLVLSPGWWEVAEAPPSLPADEQVSQEVQARLAAALGAGRSDSLTVHVAGVREGSVAAVAHGSQVLLLVPASPPPAASVLAQSVAQAVVAAALAPAPSEPRCSEPLLSLAEALVHAGVTTLATLPRELRPVGDWLDRESALAAIKTEAEAVLDSRTPWADRRLRLGQLLLPTGANPAFGQAAAALLEASGEVERFRDHPFELLLAWRNASGEPWLSLPRVLRRALADPLRAGVADKPSPDERRAISTSALTRAVANGAFPAELADAATPAELRQRAAAYRRAQGGGEVCRWLRADELPQGLLTGCRSEGETGGVVYARPGRGASFELIARSPSGAELLVLVWPHWLLFPTVLGEGEEVAFVDGRGVWSVPLDASHPPRLLAEGRYRHLTAAPGGRLLAAVEWPSGTVVLLRSEGVRRLGATGQGGVAWLTDEVLLASDGAALRFVTTGEVVRDSGLLLPDTHSLMARRGVVFAAAGTPPDAALVQVFPAEGRVERRLAAAPPTIGLAILADGTVVGGGPSLWAWQGDTVERIGAGLTPAPVP